MAILSIRIIRVMRGMSTIPDGGIPESAPVDTRVGCSNTGLDILLSAGTQLIIGGKLKIENTSVETGCIVEIDGGIAVSPL